MPLAAGRFEKNIENEPSTTNTNEDHCSGQVSGTLNILVSKLDNFEQQFKNFQAKTGNDIDILFAKLEMNTGNEKEREIDRLRKENCKLKSDNANLIECLNGHTNSVADLSNKLKAVKDEKASLLTAIRLIQSDGINTSSGDINNSLSRVQRNTARSNTRNQKTAATNTSRGKSI